MVPTTTARLGGYPSDPFPLRAPYPSPSVTMVMIYYTCHGNMGDQGAKLHWAWAFISQTNQDDDEGMW